jgi:hypothetical protein
VLAPGLLLPPPLRPRLDLASIPDAALTLAANRLGEPRLADDHGRGWWVTRRSSAISEMLTVLGLFMCEER